MQFSIDFRSENVITTDSQANRSLTNSVPLPQPGKTFFYLNRHTNTHSKRIFPPSQPCLLICVIQTTGECVSCRLTHATTWFTFIILQRNLCGFKEMGIFFFPSTSVGTIKNYRKVEEKTFCFNAAREDEKNRLAWGDCLDRH